MAKRPAILFLGIANARASLLAESVLRHLGQDSFRAYSAGSRPAEAPDPETFAFLQARGYPTVGLRSKSWDEFAGDGAPALDVVITLSNRLIGEICPVFWTGRPATTHWPMPDESSLGEIETILARRIAALIEVPLGDLPVMDLQMRLDAIGRR